MIIKIILVIILVVLALIKDLRVRRIPNKLTIPFAVIGLIVNTILDFPGGLRTALMGLLVGFLVFIIPYAMKAFGAGDVKLMSALGALTDWRSILFIGLFSAVAGGIIVTASKVASGSFGGTLRRAGHLLAFYLFSILALVVPVPTIRSKREKFRIDTSDKKNDYIPYALAIAAGSILTIVLSRTGIIQGLTI